MVAKVLRNSQAASELRRRKLSLPTHD